MLKRYYSLFIYVHGRTEQETHQEMR